MGKEHQKETLDYIPYLSKQKRVTVNSNYCKHKCTVTAYPTQPTTKTKQH